MSHVSRPIRRWCVATGFAALLAVGLSACQTLREIAALQDVEFALDQVSNVRVAGVRLDDIRAFRDLAPLDAARIITAVADHSLPLTLDIQVAATNPSENATQARLVALDWTLFLQDRRTVSGGLPQAVTLPAGQTVSVPLAVQLDLLEFFEGSGRDLVDLALNLTGQGGAPKDVRLTATPTVDTPLGPIRYPRPVTIVHQTVGS